jgi:hypothetical protein
LSPEALESPPLLLSLLAAVESAESAELESEELDAEELDPDEPDSEEIFCSRWRFFVP